MRHLLGLMLTLGFAAAPARGDLLAFESGRGNHNSRGSDAWFLRYQHDMLPLWKTTGFIEFTGGSWDWNIKNRMVGAGGGLRYALTKRSYASLAAGLAYVTDRTDNLGTHLQFQWRFALGWRVGRVDLALAQIHYSNGKSIFRWEGANVGDNFLTLQIGYLL
jgi:hypothetical protein